MQEAPKLQLRVQFTGDLNLVYGNDKKLKKCLIFILWSDNIIKSRVTMVAYRQRLDTGDAEVSELADEQD